MIGFVKKVYMRNWDLSCVEEVNTFKHGRLWLIWENCENQLKMSKDGDFPGGSVVKNPPTKGGMFQENSIETCILSRVKQITGPGWMHETGARTWCSGRTWREWVGREVGGGIGMGKMCEPKAFSFQCMTKFTTKKKKKRICLPVQETWVWFLIWEDPSAEQPSLSAITVEPVLQSPCATTTQARSLYSPCSTREATQWEALTLQLESSPCSPQLEKAHEAAMTQHRQKIDK